MVELIQNVTMHVNVPVANSYHLTPFIEKPRESESEQSVSPRLEAFELFNIFTAEVIRSRSIFYK